MLKDKCLSLEVFQSKNYFKYGPDLVVHICNPRLWGVEGEGLKVPGQPGLHSEMLSHETKG
jgi:hypothetical protein